MACRKPFAVKLSDEQIAWLKRTAAARSSTVSGVLRDALELERWVAAERANGARIFLETRDGRRREIRKQIPTR